MNKKISYWVDLAVYDLETASAMLDSKRYLYVGSMAHQTIEKILKAYFVKIVKSTPPFTHNLSSLAKQSTISKSFSEDQLDFLDILEPLNIEARYPTHKEQLLKSLGHKQCQDILIRTKELFEWIRVKL